MFDVSIPRRREERREGTHMVHDTGLLFDVEDELLAHPVLVT